MAGFEHGKIKLTTTSLNIDTKAQLVLRAITPTAMMRSWDGQTPDRTLSQIVTKGGKSTKCFASSSFSFHPNLLLLLITGGEQALELDCAHAIVGEISVWLYTSNLQAASKDPADMYPSSGMLFKIRSLKTTPAYWLAHRAIDTTRERFVALWQTPRHCIKYVYKNTDPKPKLRRYFVDLCSPHTSLDQVVEQQLDWTDKSWYEILPFNARKTKQGRAVKELSRLS